MSISSVSGKKHKLESPHSNQPVKIHRPGSLDKKIRKLKAKLEFFQAPLLQQDKGVDLNASPPNTSVKSLVKKQECFKAPLAKGDLNASAPNIQVSTVVKKLETSKAPLSSSTTNFDLNANASLIQNLFFGCNKDKALELIIKDTVENQKRCVVAAQKMASKSYVDAILILDRIPSKASSSSIATFCKAICCYKLKQYPPAIEAFQSLIQSRRFFTESKIKLACCYFEMEKYDQFYSTLLPLTVNDEVLRTKVAYIYGAYKLTKNQIDEAKVFFQGISKNHPLSAFASKKLEKYSALEKS